MPVGRTLTPAQQAGNDVLDMWDDYKALNKTQQKGKPGQALRKQMAAKADAAGLTVTTAADGTVTVTRDGKRATRTNGLSGTSEVDNFVPAQQRTPAVRDAALHLAAKVQQGGSEFTGMGVQINSKNLNPRDAKAAAKDIQEGRNTYRAALLLEEIEASLERGYFAVSTGTGLSTQKFEIPTEDFLGEAAVADIRSKQPAPLSDPELDALIAEDATVQQAIQEYGNEDGSIDVARLSADAAGKGVPYLQFMFGLSEETATKFLALTNERASQTTQEAPVTGSAAKSSPEPDGTDSGSGSPTSTQEEVAPAKPTLREQNEAAKAALSDALAEFRAARKKKGNKAYSSVLGVTPFSEEEAAALVKMVKALVKLGAVNSRRVIAGLRAGGFDENDGTDDQLRPLIRQVLKDEGVFRAKSRAPKADAPVAPTTGTATTPRASMEKVAASPAFSDATKAAVKDAGLNDYTPRSQADAVAAVEAYMQRVSLDEAVSLAASDSTALRGDVRTALRQAVLKALNDQMRVANDSNDTATAERLLEDVLRVATAYAGRGTDAGQEIAAYNLMHRFSPEAAVVQAVKQTREKADQAKAAATQKVPGVAKRARAMQKEVVEATVKSEAVAKAKAALSGDPAATTTKEPTAYGARNKFFTKEKLAALRKATGGMLFAAPVSPVVIYEGAYHLEAGVRQFAEWSKKMVRSYGAAIRPRLAEIYDLSKAEYVQQGGDPKLVQSADEVADAIAQEQAEMLATRIQQLVAAPAAPGLKDPVQQLLDTLTAKVREKLVPQPGKTKVAPREAILHALRNQEEYAAVWELAKEQVEAALSADPTLSPDQRTDLLDRLSGFYQETIGQAYATKQAADVVRSGLKELGARLDDIVRRHATEQVDAQVSLVSKLVAGAGLTPQEAQSYAAVVQKEFQRQVQAKRDTILNRLRAKIGVPPTPRKGKTALDKLFETLNLSPITDARVTEILMEQLELPTLTAADVDRLRTLADKVQAAKGERAKSAAVHELLIAQKQIAGITKGALVQAWWYANILSNYTTHIVNFVATGQNVAAEAFLAVGNVAWRKPTLALAPLRGLAKGLRLGVNSAYDAMGTGVSLPRSAEKFDTPNDLEAARDRLSLVLRYVPRLLKASDTFWQSGLREMRAYELAVSEALAAGKTRPTAEIWTDAHNRLYGADALLADAQATARQELPELGSANPAANLLREAQYQMRVHELFTAGRDKALAEAAVGYAAREAFNGELEGGLGYVMSGVSRITEWERGGVKPIKFIIPFVNIITNVTNKTLDWTPYGYVRAVRGSVGIGMGQGPTRKVRQFTAEERGKLAAKATMGALAIGAALAHLTAESISAAGPDEPEKKKLLQQTGWQPYSLHLGDKWVSYKETPLYFALAAVATLKEDEAYNGRSFESDATGYADRAFLVTFAGLKATVMNTPLKSVQELLDVFSTQGPGTSITDRFTRWGKRTVAYSGQALIPLSSLTRQLLRDYEAVMNLPRREANTVVQTLLQDVPGAMGRGGIAYDQLGNPQMVDTDRLVSEAQYRDEDTKKIHAFLLENKVSLPACNRNQSDLAVVKGLKLGQLTRAEQAEYERLPTKQQKQYLAKKAKHIGPMSDAEWSAFYQKRGELLKASLLAEMEDRSFPGTTVVREGLQSLARSNPRAMVQLISELATDAKAQALEFVIKDRSLNPAQYPPDESDDE